VASSTQSPNRIRFDRFEVDLRSGELWKNGARLRMQEQPFQVLRMLLEHRGETVTREELKQRLWPADTFVDFDDGLNTAVKKIRDLLGDSAERPRYIETIPRRGYRFAAAVEPQFTASGTLASTTAAEPAVVAPWHIRKTWLAVAVPLIVAALAFFVWTYRIHPRNKATSVRAIAVLPLENLSGDPSQDYFAAGLTDELTTELAHTVGNSLRVTSRISAEKYRNEPLAQIAHDLNVDAVIEGSVVKSGNRVRITAQLINARADKHLWAASYDRDLHDILSLQSEIAATVARQVQVTLSPRIEARLRQNQTVDPAAYDLYQRALSHAFSNNKQEMTVAVGFLQQSLARDPTFAAAHALLAREYANEVFLLQPQDGDLEAKAIQEVNEALKIDPDLAVAYLARGALLWSHRNGFPHERAVAEFKRALELDPNLAEAHHQLGLVYIHTGLFDRADRELQTALDLEPTSIAFRYRLAINLLDEGKFEEASALLQGTRSFNPDLWAYQMTLVLFKLGRKQEALTLVRDSLRQNPNDPGGLRNAVLALLYADAGQKALAQKSIEAALQKGKDFGHFHHTAYAIGSAYALMHRSKEAVRWLRAAAEDGFPCYPLYEQDSDLQNIRHDPGFLKLMREMRTDWERRRATL
jgi:TolB-like protein/DNA-binding winged helix-turn-helix (wHTH) protein/Tfp pilus assembly protein PilF